MKTLLSVAVLSAITGSAWAAGTAAGTDIDNTASIAYSVGGTSQTAIESSEAGNSTPGAGQGTATTFKVDKKIDLLVTGATTTNVVPGQTGVDDNTELNFTLKNEGNSTESFTLTPSQVATGGTDTFDTSNCTVTTPALPVSLTADQTIAVKVECDIPPSSAVVTNGASSLVDLLAEAQGAAAQAAADAGADNPATVQTVLADDTGTGTDGAIRNAKHSAISTYTLNTADLSVGKTSAVTADPENGVSANAKRIPGATIEYTITVSNAAGAAAATGIVISDALPGDLTYSSCSVSGSGIANCAEAGGSITSGAFDLAAGETATLTIIATVN